MLQESTFAWTTQNVRASSFYPKTYFRSSVKVGILQIFSKVYNSSIRIMLWNETNFLFNRTKMKVLISSQEGLSVSMDVSPEMTIDQLKISAVSSFYGPDDSIKMSLYYKLVTVEGGRNLPDEKSIRQMGIEDEGKYNYLITKLVRNGRLFGVATKGQHKKRTSQQSDNMAPLINFWMSMQSIPIQTQLLVCHELGVFY